MAALIRGNRRNRGSAMVEAALTLPVLILLMFAIIDFGLYFESYFAARNAARVGARIASNHHAECTPASLSLDVRAAVEDVIARSGIAGSADAEIDFPLGDDKLCGAEDDRLVAVEVRIPYRLRMLAPLLEAPGGFDADIPIVASDTQRDFN